MLHYSPLTRFSSPLNILIYFIYLHKEHICILELSYNGEDYDYFEQIVNLSQKIISSKLTTVFCNIFYY